MQPECPNDLYSTIVSTCLRTRVSLIALPEQIHRVHAIRWPDAQVVLRVEAADIVPPNHLARDFFS
jgi:hypothetical protein